MYKGPLTIHQEPEGYRFSSEPFFLADFATLEPHWHVLDIGTGCGIIPLLLSVREPYLEITAVEIQKLLYRSAVRNVFENAVSQTIRLHHGDFLKLAESFGSFDLIISNPPFRKINSGRLNPNKVKAIARHELTLSLSQLLEKSTRLLKRGGKFVLAYHLDRLEEALEQLRDQQLAPSRLRMIHGYKHTEAKIFLVEAVKEGVTHLVTEDPFYIYHEDGSYTPEMKKIYASFNYPCRSHRLREKRSSACAG